MVVATTEQHGLVVRYIDMSGIMALEEAVDAATFVKTDVQRHDCS